MRDIISTYRGAGEEIAFSWAGSEKGHAGKKSKGHGACDSGRGHKPGPYQASPTAGTPAEQPLSMKLTADSNEQGANLRGAAATLVTLQVTSPTLLNRGTQAHIKPGACCFVLPGGGRGRHLSCPVTQGTMLRI